MVAEERPKSNKSWWRKSASGETRLPKVTLGDKRRPGEGVVGLTGLPQTFDSPELHPPDANLEGCLRRWHKGGP